ncbi:UNVERIFIED_CONTAM: hypothetical protein FKN15_025915 [Acipenser sinensis]
MLCEVTERFELLDSGKHYFPRGIIKVEEKDGSQTPQAAVTVQIASKEVTFQVPAGTRPLRSHLGGLNFIRTPSHDRLLAEMMQSHMVKDMCLIGGKGSGKSVIAKEFSEMLGYNVEPIMLYQDMTARDVLQQRYTLPNGDTAWRPSPLVTAAQEGKLVLLDGIHRVNLGTLSVLSRLIHDRELTLYDGTRLLRVDRYESLKEELQLSDEELQKRFLPNLARSALQKNLLDSGIEDSSVVSNQEEKDTSCEIKDGTLKIGNVSVPIYNPDEKMKVPDILFYENTQHMMVMEDMLKDFLLGEHLLLVGNQGPVFLRVQGYPLERHEARALSFTEEQAHWQIPMNEVNIVCDVTTATDTIYVATCNPVSLYAMHVSGDTVQCMDLYDVFPRTISGVWQPFVTVAALGSPLQGQVVLHEEQSNAVLHLDVMSGAVRRIILSPEGQETPKNPSSWWSNKQDQGAFKMCREFSQKNWLVFYKENQNHLDVLDVLEGRAHTISLPINLKSVFLVAEDRWLLVESKTKQKFLLTKPMHMGAEDTGICQLHTITEDPVSTGFGTTSGVELTVPYEVSRDQLPAENLGAALGQKIVSPNRVLADENNYAAIVIGFPDLMSPNEVYSWKRTSPLAGSSSAKTIFTEDRQSGAVKQTNCVSLLGANQLIRAVPAGDVPLKELYPKEALTVNCPARLVAMSYIIGRSRTLSPYSSWLSKISHTDVLLASMGGGGVVTVDMGGYVRLWETGLDTLQRSLLEWQSMIGQEDGRPVQITVQRDSGLDVSSPKHGKVDHDNTPHVGGNMWAGGTGGRDTAGLGGKGGPYRLDAGHKVHQVSQAEKDAVPEEVKRAAREMAEKAFKDRLKEIHMSEYDASMYEKFSGAVKRQVQSLRVILDSLQYDIVGHSGDGFDIELVRCDKIPKNNKERLKVLKTMHAHSQFCMSGDYTLESTEHAVKEIAREEADEYFVIVLSDANLERYGISPDRFAQALTCNPQVNAFAVLIGSLGDQAVRLQRTLPAGRSFVAMDTKQIPQILQQIFTSTMLSSA